MTQTLVENYFTSKRFCFHHVTILLGSYSLAREKEIKAQSYILQLSSLYKFQKIPL